MRGKAPLALMEQLVMLLVFALSGALCLQAFVASDARSQRNQDRDRAVTLCENAAEAVRHCRGDLSEAAALLDCPFAGMGTELSIGFAADWTRCESQDYTWLLRVKKLDSGVAYLGTALVELSSAEGDRLFSIETAWQEVDGDAA